MQSTTYGRKRGSFALPKGEKGKLPGLGVQMRFRASGIFQKKAKKNRKKHYPGKESPGASSTYKICVKPAGRPGGSKNDEENKKGKFSAEG